VFFPSTRVGQDVFVVFYSEGGTRGGVVFRLGGGGSFFHISDFFPTPPPKKASPPGCGSVVCSGAGWGSPPLCPNLFLFLPFSPQKQGMLEQVTPFRKVFFSRPLLQNPSLYPPGYGPPPHSRGAFAPWAPWGGGGGGGWGVLLWLIFGCCGRVGPRFLLFPDPHICPQKLNVVFLSCLWGLLPCVFGVGWRFFWRVVLLGESALFLGGLLGGGFAIVECVCFRCGPCGWPFSLWRGERWCLSFNVMVATFFCALVSPLVGWGERVFSPG